MGSPTTSGDVEADPPTCEVPVSTSTRNRPVIPTSWHDAMDRYQTQQHAAGRSRGTIRLHAHYLSLLARRHPRRSPWSLTPDDLTVFLAKPSWSPETRKSARSTVRAFYRYAHGRGWIELDPSLTLAPVTIPPPMPRPTPEHLVAQLVKRNDRIGFMAMLGAHAGLRAAEIAQVHAEHYTGDARAGDLLVRGKGRKLRLVPIVNPKLAWRLSQLDGYAFPNGLGSHLSPGHVTKLLSAELPDGWTAHTLRHRMATQAYNGTRDLLAVGQVLGHSRPETTQRYVLMPGDALRAAVAAAS